MLIETKGWTAQIDRMPGSVCLRTFGTVTVADSRIIAKLEPMITTREASTDLKLELKLAAPQDVALQVLTDVFVEYKIMGEPGVTSVSIYFEDKLLHRIDDILITN